MKKIFIFLLGVAAIISCKKGTINVGKCKVSRVIHFSNGSYDTTFTVYSGDSILTKVTYSNYPSVLTYSYIKSGNQYLMKRYTDGVEDLDGFFTLNTQGLIDTNRVTHIPSMLFNNKTKCYYNADGYATRIITDYTNYVNDVKYYYSGGNYSYWIYDFYDNVTPANTRRDSVVFEYYLDKPKLAGRNALEDKYGKLEKNLVKKFTFYNTSSGTVRKTYDYAYITDSKGLVTRQFFTAIDQPSGVITSKDTTDYEYICN